MKRVIKFYNPYSRDAAAFSDCSTKYEILPVIVDNDANEEDLTRLASKLGLVATGDAVTNAPHAWGYRELTITHALPVGTKLLKAKTRWNEEERVPEFLGFITLPCESDDAPLCESIGNELTAEQASEIVNNQEFGVSDVGELIDGGIVLVKNGWSYYHALPLTGYDLKKFEEVLEVTDEGFYDDTYRCDGCNKFDSRDNGYTYNFREHGDGRLGVNCGCYDEACENDFSDFVNEPGKAMELKTAESLETKGVLTHVERFIGGMVDGRGGRWGGESVREGDPKSILKELLDAEPNAEFVFTHDESGQFQTYFSVWRVGPDLTEIKARGFDVGKSIGEEQEIDTTLPENEAKDDYITDCADAEENYRSYSPFELTAKEFNDAPNSDAVWAAYEEGLTAGYEAAWAHAAEGLTFGTSEDA